MEEVKGGRGKRRVSEWMSERRSERSKDWRKWKAEEGVGVSEWISERGSEEG